MAEVFRWFVILAGVCLIVWLIGRTVRRARQLGGRIEEYHKEQEEHPGDPYAALAAILTDQQERDSRMTINRATAWIDQRLARLVARLKRGAG